MAALFLIAIAVVATVVQDVGCQGVLIDGGQPCLSDTSCNGHGTCKKTCETDMSHQPCKCNNNYTGPFCDKPPICTTHGGECGAHGRCIESWRTRTLVCNCSDYYWGSFCQIAPICTPHGNECGTYGECNACHSSPYGVGTRSRSSCQCNSGYGGEYCDKAPVCTNGGNECKNGGECDFTILPYSCTCLPEFAALSETCGASHMVIVIPSLVLTLLGSFMMTEY